MSIAGLAAGGVKRRIGACLECVVPSSGNRLMTLWFVFALMTAAAIFAVLWPLEPQLGAAGRRQRGRRLQGSTRRDRSRCRGRADRRCPKRKPRASKSAAACWPRPTASSDLPAPLEPRPAPRRRPSSRWSALPVAAVAFYLPLGSPRLADFPLAARTRTADANQPLDNHGGAGRSASGKKSDRWPRLERAGAGAGAARPLRRCGPRLSQFHHL